MVSFGASNGALDPVVVGTLSAKGSLFLTRSWLAAHATELGEYYQRVGAVIGAVITGVIKVAAWNVFSLSDAAAALAVLEGDHSAGAILLKPRQHIIRNRTILMVEVPTGQQLSFDLHPLYNKFNKRKYTDKLVHFTVVC